MYNGASRSMAGAVPPTGVIRWSRTVVWDAPPDSDSGAPLQMTGCAQSIAYGPCDARTWHPDLDWLQREFEGRSPPKLVYLVNPGNPSGDSLPVSGPVSLAGFVLTLEP